MEHVNDKIVRDSDSVLDEKYRKRGSPERTKFEEEAYAFIIGEIQSHAEI